MHGKHVQSADRSGGVLVKRLLDRAGRSGLALECEAIAGGGVSESANQIDGVLGDLVEGGDRLGVRLEAALGDDEIRKLRRHIGVGKLQRAACKGAEGAGSRSADHCRTGGDGGREVAIALFGETLEIGKVGERNLAENLGAVGKRTRNSAVGADGKTGQGATGVSVLADAVGGAGSGDLGDDALAGGVGQIPIERETASIRETCDVYGDGSGAGQVAAAVEAEIAGGNGGASANPAFDVAAGQGRGVTPTGTGAGGGKTGVSEIDVEHVRGAERIVHRDAGVVGVSDVGIGAEVCLNREVGGGTGRTGHADWQLNRREPAVGIYRAVSGGIAHDLVAVGGDQIAVGVLGESAAAGVAGVAAVLHDEESVAGDGDIRIDSGALDTAAAEIGIDRSDRGPRADLELIARAVAAKQVVEHILEVDSGVLVAGGVEVGQIVGDGGKGGVTGVQSGEWYGEIWH